MSEKMREEFEAWARNEHFVDSGRDAIGRYRSQEVDDMWFAWKASRESLVIELPSYDDLMMKHLGHPFEVRDECAAYVENAGLKVKP